MDEWEIGLFADNRQLLSATVIATRYVGQNEGDHLVVVPEICSGLPGTQDDDDIVAIAAIDLVRVLVGAYDAAGKEGS